MKICLYGAGSTQIKSKYIDEAYKLGEEIAKRGHSLVFGGGSTGIMGAVSKGVIDNNGKVLGIAPEWMSELKGCPMSVMNLSIQNPWMREKDYS